MLSRGLRVRARRPRAACSRSGVALEASRCDSPGGADNLELGPNPIWEHSLHPLQALVLHRSLGGADRHKLGHAGHDVTGQASGAVFRPPGIPRAARQRAARTTNVPSRHPALPCECYVLMYVVICPAPRAVCSGDELVMLPYLR